MGSSFQDMPVLSLRTGSRVGRVVGHLINPHKLRIDALWCQVGSVRAPRLVVIDDLRETTPGSVIIDDENVAIDPSDAIRLGPVIDMSYELLDKKVISGRIPLGRVCDYAVDSGDFSVQKIYASPNVWSALKTSKLIYDRSQIVEVSQTYVKVTDSAVRSARKPALARPRPQRSLNPAPSTTSLTSE
jgi:uncharacterized protein YrrD